MKHNSSSPLRKIPAARLSQAVLYAIIALAVIFFGMFWLVGYNTPSDDGSAFVSPRFTDALMVFAYSLTAIAVAVAFVSAVHTVRTRQVAGGKTNGIPARAIAWSVVALLLLAMVGGFVFASGSALTVNGREYADTFWLKTTDMLITTITVLSLAAVAAVAFGMSGISRRYGRGGSGGQKRAGKKTNQ